MKDIVTYINEARMKPVKNVPQDQVKAWWKKNFMSGYNRGLEHWKDDVTFEDIYNKIRQNGPENPEDGLWDMIWTNGKDYSNLPYARQWIYRALAERYKIHGGKIDLGGEYASGTRSPGVDYDNFLKKWIHEN